LHANGGRILLDPAIQVTHHKRWTLMSMFMTDSLRRARPWMRLALSHGLPEKLNFRWQDRLSIVISVLLVVLTPAMLADVSWCVAWLACWLILAALQRRFLGFLIEQRGWLFAVASLPLYATHALAAAAGALLGSLDSLRRS
jgi:hypothetical protein